MCSCEAIIPILEIGTPKQGEYLNRKEVPSEVKERWIRNNLLLVSPWCSLCIFVVSAESVWVHKVFFLPETTGCLWETSP